MKNYRKIMPIILIFLSVLAWYTMLGDAIALDKEYKGYIENARNKVEDEIYIEAIKEYQKALKMNKSKELVLEIADVLVLQDKKRDIITWGEYMINNYPTDVEGYDYMINQYWKDENYVSFFTTYEIVEERDLISKETQEKRDKIEYIYDIDYRRFDQVKSFNGGLYPVGVEGLWGYTNSIGEVMIECRYLKAGGFSLDFASVRKQSREDVFIDKEENKVIALPKDIKVDEIGNLGNDLYPLLSNNQYSYYNARKSEKLNGYNKATTFNEGVAAIEDTEGWKFIKTNGKTLGSGVYENIIVDDQAISFRNERGFAKTKDGYVMIDETGSPVNKEIYQNADVFMGGDYAAVQINNKWGFIDTKGNIVIEPQFEAARSFSNELAAVQVEDKWGFIDTKGNIVIEPIFQDAQYFNETDCAYIKEDDSWSMLKLVRSNY